VRLALVRGFLQVYGRAPVEALDSLVADDFTTACEDLGHGGIDLLRRHHETLRLRLPDFEMRERGVHAGIDRVVVRWEAVAGGGRLRSLGSSVFRFRNGRISAKWDLIEDPRLFEEAHLISPKRE
jgi:hypothetical protein